MQRSVPLGLNFLCLHWVVGLFESCLAPPRLENKAGKTTGYRGILLPRDPGNRLPVRRQRMSATWRNHLFWRLLGHPDWSDPENHVCSSVTSETLNKCSWLSSCVACRCCLLCSVRYFREGIRRKWWIRLPGPTRPWASIQTFGRQHGVPFCWRIPRPQKSTTSINVFAPSATQNKLQIAYIWIRIYWEIEHIIWHLLKLSLWKIPTLYWSR